MFTAALFTIARIWEQSKCPSTVKQIKVGGVCVCTTEYYSAIKKNEILTFAAMWMELENILSEMNQTEDKLLMWNLRD